MPKKSQDFSIDEGLCFGNLHVVLARTAVDRGLGRGKSVLFWCPRPWPGTKGAIVKLDSNEAPCSRQTTNFIGPLHECNKVCPCTKDLLISGIRQLAEVKKGSPTKQTLIWGTKTRPIFSTHVNNAWEESPTSPNHFPAPLIHIKETLNN